MAESQEGGNEVGEGTKRKVPEVTRPVYTVRPAAQIPMSYGPRTQQLHEFTRSLAVTGTSLPSTGLPSVSEEALALNAEIAKLQVKLNDALHQLEKERSASIQWKKLHADAAEIKEKLAIRHLLDRVCDKAHEALLQPESVLKAHFGDDQVCPAFVMSIDIRRSTELMLKARTPDKFATFITELCAELGQIVKGNFGVFDKFTGDGILAFFPEFFSGPGAGFLAVRAADQCHKAFNEHYTANRSCFFSVLKDTGLGIGIDYGNVQLDVRFVNS